MIWSVVVLRFMFSLLSMVRKAFSLILVFQRKNCKTANTVSFISLSYRLFEIGSHLGAALVDGYVVFSVNSLTVEMREVYDFRIKIPNLCNRSSIQFHSVFFILVFVFYCFFSKLFFEIFKKQFTPLKKCFCFFCIFSTVRFMIASVFPFLVVFCLFGFRFISLCS